MKGSCTDYVLLAHTIFKYSCCSIKCNSNVNVNTHLSKFARLRVNIHLCLQTVEQGDAEFRYFTQGCGGGGGGGGGGGVCERKSRCWGQT